MSSFQKKVTSSYIWSFVETFGSQAIQFAFGVFLARILSPEDYGLVGALSLFLGIASVLIDGGFKTSIVRSKDLTDKDCYTIFYLNLCVSTLISILFFISATYISRYFERSELINIIRVLALIPLINGLGLVQSALILKNLKFKLNAKISLAANIISGAIAIIMAFNGYSYWALVWKSLSMTLLYNCFVWFASSWSPKLYFSLHLLKKHFNFSSKILLIGLIDTFFDNIYSFFFGKYFSMKDLGFFTRGKGYAELVTNSTSVAMQKVNTPLLSAYTKTDESIIDLYSKIQRTSALIIFPITIILFCLAEPAILFLLGPKWMSSVIYLKIFSISGIMYSILNNNSSLLEVFGRSDLLLKTTLICRPIQVIIILITINFSPIVVSLGVIVHFLFVFLVSTFFVLKVTKRGLLGLYRSLLYPAIVSLIIGLVLFIFQNYLINQTRPLFQLVALSILGVITFVILIRIFKMPEYLIVTQVLNNFRFKKLKT